jgi:hypothetical protein
MRFGDGDVYRAIMETLIVAPRCVKHIGVNLVEPPGRPAFYEVAASAFNHSGQWTKIPADASEAEARQRVGRFLGSLIQPRGVAEIKKENREYLFWPEFDPPPPADSAP